MISKITRKELISSKNTEIIEKIKGMLENNNIEYEQKIVSPTRPTCFCSIPKDKSEKIAKRFDENIEYAIYINKKDYDMELKLL